jgi:hypothetical protein
MRKIVSPAVLVALMLASAAFAHDPRTVAKDFSHSLSVEGAGKLTISYKSLHYNEAAYLGAKNNERTLANLNRVWKKIGKFDSEFEIMAGDIKVPKGSYDLGIGFDAHDNFKLILGSGGKEIEIPLKSATDGPEVSFLSFDTRPTNDTDSFTIEGRYGKIRASADFTVPYLGAHTHDSPDEHHHEMKAPEKKP